MYRKASVFENLPDLEMLPESSRRIVAAAIAAGIQVEAAAQAVINTMAPYHEPSHKGKILS